MEEDGDGQLYSSLLIKWRMYLFMRNHTHPHEGWLSQ